MQFIGFERTSSGRSLAVFAMAAAALMAPLPIITAFEPPTTSATDDGKNIAWVEQRITQWQPSERERAFERIGWGKDLIATERLAKEHGRGLFVFTYDGADLSGYRC